MACVNADGSLTPVALQVLNAIVSLDGAGTAEVIARTTGLPPYRVRATLREMAGAGLVVANGSGPRLTEAGLARLSEPAPA